MSIANVVQMKEQRKSYLMIRLLQLRRKGNIFLIMNHLVVIEALQIQGFYNWLCVCVWERDRDTERDREGEKELPQE